MNEKTKKGIAAFTHEQQVLLRLIRKHNPLTASKFDEIFSSYPRYTRIVNGERVFIRSKLRGAITGETFMIAPFHGEGGWQWWLGLTQIMCELGLITTNTIDGEIVYL